MKQRIPPLIQAMFAEPHRYPFQQVLHLLEKHCLGAAGIDADHEHQVRLLPAAEMSFPSADIKRARLNTRGNITMELSFMGLYGVDSPLPSYFSALTLQDNAIAQCMRQFLAILNHRIYVLYYLAWKKYQAHIHYNEADNHYKHYLKAIAGNKVLITEQEEYTYAGLLGSRSQNAAALADIVQHFLGGISVIIKPFQPQWITLARNNHLSNKPLKELKLGDNILIGTRVLDVNYKILIQIGPMPSTKALELLPHTDTAKRLVSLIRRYLKPTMQFDLLLLIDYRQASVLQLGQENMCLGWSTYLGQPTKKLQQVTISSRCL